MKNSAYMCNNFRSRSMHIYILRKCGWGCYCPPLERLESQAWGKGWGSLEVNHRSAWGKGRGSSPAVTVTSPSAVMSSNE